MKFLKDLYFNSTLPGIIILALSLFFLMIINQEKGITLSKYLTPLFIIVICLEIYFIRTQVISDISSTENPLDKQIFSSISSIRKSIQDETDIDLFSSGKEFDDYLEYRLKKADKIRIIHLGDYIPAEENEQRRYLQIIQRFIRENIEFRRIISKTNNLLVNNWIKKEIENYENDRYFLFLNKKIITNNNIRTMGVIIIDNQEVILGGGHKETFKQPILSIRNHKIVSFYNNYFEYLQAESSRIEKWNIQELDD